MQKTTVTIEQILHPVKAESCSSFFKEIKEIQYIVSVDGKKTLDVTKPTDLMRSTDLHAIFNELNNRNIPAGRAKASRFEMKLKQMMHEKSKMPDGLVHVMMGKEQMKIKDEVIEAINDILKMADLKFEPVVKNNFPNGNITPETLENLTSHIKRVVDEWNANLTAR